MSSARVPKNPGSFPVKRLSDAQLKQENEFRVVNKNLLEL